MKWTLTQINPGELHTWWPLVRPGLERVRVKARASWLCEDIYSAVRTARATMHVGYIDQHYAGVLVLTINVDPFTAESVDERVLAGFRNHGANRVSGDVAVRSQGLQAGGN